MAGGEIAAMGDAGVMPMPAGKDRHGLKAGEITDLRGPLRLVKRDAAADGFHLDRLGDQRLAVIEETELRLVGDLERLRHLGACPERHGDRRIGAGIADMDAGKNSDF